MRKHNFTSDLRLGGSAAYNGAVAGLAATAQGMLLALQSVACAAPAPLKQLSRDDLDEQSRHLHGR